jgi:hypothetical protein
LVRTQHLPRPAQIARELGFPGLADCSFGRREVPLRPWESGRFLAEIGTAAAGAAKTDTFLGERYVSEMSFIAIATAAAGTGGTT